MIQAPRGTRDIYGDEMRLWRKAEDEIRAVTDVFGFTEIRTPIFESTDLFLRGVGETTDIVQKEMYTFEDKSGRSLTLRPELTASVARAYIERGMHNRPQPTKLFYIGPCFRYENPQAGRYRQHYQFGVEVFGALTPAVEAEVISLVFTLFSQLGIEGVKVHINSIGCAPCRKVYNEKLQAFLDACDGLCGLCNDRKSKNPLRVLDCKNENCQALIAGAPRVLDALCDECVDHFAGLQDLLERFNIPFVVDGKVVRGLDYYTRTVFEFMRYEGDTALPQSILGGGRYDGLIGQLGGAPTGGVGLGLGIDRLVLLMQKQTLVEPKGPDIFIGHADAEGFAAACVLVNALRQSGLYAECDPANRSVKAQMKYADKIKARFTAILGATELQRNATVLKNMQTGELHNMSLDEIYEFLDPNSSPPPA